MIGLVMTTAFAAFMTNTVYTEERAVEAQLARMRVYWAEMGNFQYALSRISFSQLCNPCGKAKDSALAPVLQAYFNELSNNKLWTYPEESSNYSITITDVAATQGGQNFSGYLMATSVLSTSSLVSNFAGNLPLMELRICAGLSSPTGSCGPINSNNGGNTTANYSINRLTNLPGP